ncbi:aminoacyl-tRNA hydrolase, partial [Glutamicibacter halophytocola]
QRQRLLDKYAARLVAGSIVVTASDERSQWRNRQIAMEKLGRLVDQGLAADAPQRKATKPTRGSQRRRLNAKSSRSITKQLRRKPGQE